MRLSQIKLAGFKSFVDPTSILLPSNLTGVVGPNGCGKSNVIDAVRWVMGESSAKHLRGDSMADVIFNGSSSRKPVGMATIELVFDNSDGAIGGQFASYNEVSVKRALSRDGTSTYYLNNTRCRRKDITSIFLGTGLGPRSYSIIEQGMISRIIEARPEELRVYLEEAAGISKYKERRRETEHRIRHTRENLERLEDLREEVGKHLKHLQRQANVAERYKRYKEEQRLLEAQLLVLKLQGLEAQGEQEQSVVGERQTVLEAAVAEKRRLEAEIEKTREEHVARLDDVNKVQERYYRLGADIARHEQSVAHARDIRARQEDDLEQTATEIVELRAHINRDESDLVKLVAVLTDLEPSLEQARQRQQAAQQALEEADAAVAEWQEAWNAHNGAVNDARQIAEVERARIEQLESQARGFGQRRERIEEESDSLSVSDIERELMTLEEDDRQQQQRLAGLASELEATLAQLDAERERDQQLTAELDDERSNLQSLRGRLASLEALQQAALGADNETVTRWLENGNYQDAPRLAQKLEVKPGWERAVETVLGDYLEAVCVDGIEPAAALLGELESGAVAFVTGEPASSSASTDRLAAYVSGPAALGSLLNDVFVADSLDAALAMRGRLQSGQSVITADGIWLGSSWLRVNRADDAHAGVIVREKALRELRDGEREVAEGVEALQERHRNTREQIRLLEQQRDDRQLEHNQANRAYADLTARLGGRRLRLDQVNKRLADLARETEDIRVSLGEVESKTRDARGRLEAAVERMATLEEQRIELEERRARCVEQRGEARERADERRMAAHDLALQLESQRSTQVSASASLERMQSQLAHLDRRQQEIRQKIVDGEAPLKDEQAQLATKLDERVEVETALTEARTVADAVDARLREVDEARQRSEGDVQSAREQLDDIRMRAQETRIRRESCAEQFAETGLERDAVQNELPEEAAVGEWETRLEAMTTRIQRLGPINLAAIDEFEEESKRQEYLDSQYEDLTEALGTLENAIRKIDRETRTRFKETFDRVDAQMKSIFPRLFGGGHAHLELTGDDLLSAGVAVMARPPGKRISNIHLMSGGEKALTAVALVFSIFELNPAPFCMLDEVDAPLDDANVARFCDIVKEMSERVQFVIITHNKVTMELASHLAGVTMQEPGVSRLVAVDVDEAVQLAAV